MIRLFIIIFGVLSISIVEASAISAKEPPRFKEHACVVCIGHPTSPFNEKTPIRYKHALEINESTSYRTAVKQDEKAGIRNLRNLALNAFLEEHWAFLPTKNLWVEIGYGETLGSTEIDFDFLEDLIKQNEDLAIYHIHLKKYIMSLKKKGYEDVSQSCLVVPSFEDIALMVYFSSQFQEYHPGGRISWKICSPLGVTQYSLTDKGIEHFKQISEDAFFLEYFYPTNAKVIDPESVSSFNISVPYSVKDLIQWANDMGKGYVKVKYLPYKSTSIPTTTYATK